VNEETEKLNPTSDRIVISIFKIAKLTYGAIGKAIALQTLLSHIKPI
jgi:hypothetical protein